MYWRWLECVVLQFSFLCLLFATHFDEQDDSNGEDYDENDGYKYSFEEELNKAHIDRESRV